MNRLFSILSGPHIGDSYHAKETESFLHTKRSGTLTDLLMADVPYDRFACYARFLCMLCLKSTLRKEFLKLDPENTYSDSWSRNPKASAIDINETVADLIPISEKLNKAAILLDDDLKEDFDVQDVTVRLARICIQILRDAI